MPVNNFNINGLTDKQVILSRQKYGQNKLNYKKENSLLSTIKRIVKEPMIILLLIAAFIYFISGKTNDGLFLLAAIVFQISISLFQYSRSKNALDKLKDFTQPKCKVIRNGKEQEIKSEEIVVGDSLIVDEGISLVADGIIIHSNDFSVNESILTGESLSVFKDKTKQDNHVYSGTTVVTGLAIVSITAIGNQTKLGKIGTSLEHIKDEKTPLEIQISDFVKKMVIVGTIVFSMVLIINYLYSQDLPNSLLQSLTLAMSILPEEIPVAFTTFMALGAWRLMKIGIVVKQMKTVETLGSATIICVDKTGTITENKMTLAKIFLLSTKKIIDSEKINTEQEKQLLTTAMWASEPIPFDPMEIALHKAYEEMCQNDERSNYKLIQEYPLSGKPPMMTHIFESSNGKRIIAAKGAPEAILKVSMLSEVEKNITCDAINTLSVDGYRILGVALSPFAEKKFPPHQQDFQFKFLGVVAFYDPPKKNIQKVFEDFYRAGISVKIITGDNTATTQAIAKKVGFKDYDKSMSGDELMAANENELQTNAINTNIFTRMFPEAKLKIINALKQNNQIVAMTGDGVNDGPALKAAHIGIAMGKKGTEIAKQAASLILLEDDLSKMVEAVAMGRKIYANLKKAIQYIISIHIPIILIVFIPLALRWTYPNIFSPIHIIFLELIMGPTCSIIYENEPMEKNTMSQKPKLFTTTFFNWKELSTSFVQGITITIGTLSIYQYSILNNYNEALTRTMVFTVLIVANIFLTLINRSFYYSMLTTIKYKNPMVPLIILITIILLGLLLYVKPLTMFFEFELLDFSQLTIAIGTGFVSVAWYEIIKIYKRKKLNIY